MFLIIHSLNRLAFRIFLFYTLSLQSSIILIDVYFIFFHYWFWIQFLKILYTLILTYLFTIMLFLWTFLMLSGILVIYFPKVNSCYFCLMEKHPFLYILSFVWMMVVSNCDDWLVVFQLFISFLYIFSPFEWAATHIALFNIYTR